MKPHNSYSADNNKLGFHYRWIICCNFHMFRLHSGKMIRQVAFVPKTVEQFCSFFPYSIFVFSCMLQHAISRAEYLCNPLKSKEARWIVQFWRKQKQKHLLYVCQSAISTQPHVLIQIEYFQACSIHMVSLFVFFLLLLFPSLSLLLFLESMKRKEKRKLHLIEQNVAM